MMFAIWAGRADRLRRTMLAGPLRVMLPVMSFMVSLVPGTVARAQSPDMVGSLAQDERPWAEDVPVDRQEAARKLFDEANALMRDTFFPRAAARYQEALALWAHPGIHYNLAIAQLGLDQPIEAHASLEKALQYGPGPLGQEKYDQAHRYLKVLDDQLARMEVVCDEGGAAVTLDGKHLFTGPGRAEILVRPGGHQLVASKDGRIPDAKPVVLAPGERARYELALRAPETVESTRRWAVWKPWVTVGAGAALVLGAAYLDQRSSEAFDQFDLDFDALCMTGCPAAEVPVALEEDLSGAARVQRMAQISYAVGGAALATGVVLAYLNRERLVRRGGPREAMQVSLVPRLAPDGAGVVAGIRF